MTSSSSLREAGQEPETTPIPDDVLAFPGDSWAVTGWVKFRHFAGYMAARYNGPVYLVGSSLRSGTPRDIDIRVVVADAEFCGRYHLGHYGEWSTMAMPWTRAKQIARAFRGMDVFPDEYRGPWTIDELNELFLQPARIQREACEAAGRYIPMIQENVRGAIPWVGRSNWHYGSFHLWGDVPALMPVTTRGVMKQGVAHRSESNNFHQGKYDGVKVKGQAFNTTAERAIKNTGASWFNVPGPGGKVANNNPARGESIGEGRKLPPSVNASIKAGKSPARWTNPDEHYFGGIENAADGRKGVGIGSASWQAKEDRHPDDPRNFYSKSSARKAASARIAMIPPALSSYIARTFYPSREAVA